jgi:hypothetical protein
LKLFCHDFTAIARWLGELNNKVSYGAIAHFSCVKTRYYFGFELNKRPRFMGIVQNEGKERLMTNKSKTPVTFIVLKRSNSNTLEQEQLRQSRIKFNLACTLVAVSAAFGFTGIGLFLSGRISEDAALQTVDLLSRIVPMFVQLIEGKPSESEQ